MSVAIISRPIDGASNWNAVGNPVVYRIQRIDDGYNQINDDGGFVQLQINGIDRTDFWEVGDTLYLTKVTGVDFDVLAEITASAFSGGNTLVTIDVVYSGAGTGLMIHQTKRPDYKCNIEVFRSSNDESLTGFTLSRSPDYTGLILADVSAVVKSFISAEWTNPVSDFENDTDAFIKFYIKYQEYHGGSVQGSLNDDVANPIHAVFAALQVGSANGGNMLAYLPDSSSRLWLTKFGLTSALQGLRCWRDWPFSVSFISDNVTLTTIAIEQYDVSGTVLTRSGVAGPDNNNEAISRVKIPTTTLNASTKTIKLYLKGPSDGVTATDPTENAPITLNEALAQTYPAGVYYFSGGGSAVPAPTWGGSATMTISVRNSSSGLTQTLATGGPEAGSDALSATISYQPFTIAIAFDQIQLVVSSGGPGTYSYSFSVNMMMTNILAELLIDVEDVCDYNSDNNLIPGQNPIYLFWKNSLGGDSFWMFPFYHRSRDNFSTSKARRMTLFATDLTPVQWEAINELKTVGEVYQPVMTELTSSVNSTTKRIGQQVYMVDASGNKTGVVVIPSTEDRSNRNTTHSIAIEIELPEVLSI